MTAKRIKEQLDEAEKRIKMKLAEELAGRGISMDAIDDLNGFVALKKINLLAELVDQKIDELIEEIRKCLK